MRRKRVRKVIKSGDFEYVWKYHHDFIPVNKPEWNQPGQKLSSNQRAILATVDVTPTMWTKMLRNGPQTVPELVALCRILDCQPNDIISIPKYHRLYE
jgi:hypothetical protein